MCCWASLPILKNMPANWPIISKELRIHIDQTEAADGLPIYRRRLQRRIFMAKELKPGDRAQWNTPQGKTTGTVKKKLTSAKRSKDMSPKPQERIPSI